MRQELILTIEQIESLKLQSEILKFPKDFDLAYQGQILPGVIILLAGEIRLIDKKNERSLENPGSMIGWKTINEKKKSNFQVRVMADTEIILIGRSQIPLLKEIVPELALLLNQTARRKRSPKKNSNDHC